MGFWDSFGNALGSAMGDGLKSAGKTMEKEQELVAKARQLDDETLIRRYKSENDFKKKYAYGMVLKERGHGK